MDYLSDTSLQKLHTLSKQFTDGKLPDFVKMAAVASEKPAVNAPLSVYGDAIKRQFPCHTKMATWLSNFYFWGQRFNGEKFTNADAIASRLEKSAEYWHLKPDVTKMVADMRVKSAAPERKLTDDDYALVVNYGSERIRRFPIVNATTVKKAAANLKKFCVSYPYAWRKKAAVNTLRKAMELNAMPDAADLDYIVKAAGVYPADDNAIAQAVSLKANLFPDDVKARLRKAAEQIRDGQTKDMEKLCTILDTLDRHYKKYVMYNAGMPMPEEICYSGATEKHASVDNDFVQMTTGNMFDLEAIKKAGIEPFSVLNPDYVSAVVANDKGDLDMAKVAAVLPTMPKDDAATLEKAFSAVGIRPLVKSAARNNLAHEMSLTGWMDVLGTKPNSDFSSSMVLKHPQGLHDELAKKAKKEDNA